jgi:hypothetical protein
MLVTACETCRDLTTYISIFTDHTSKEAQIDQSRLTLVLSTWVVLVVVQFYREPRHNGYLGRYMYLVITCY